MAFWLGDEDGKGDVYENAVEPASASFATAINMLLPASGAVTAGTIYSVSGTYTGSHRYESPRSAIGYVCDTMSTTSVPVSWRVNGNATLDAGPDSNLFVVNPTCVITTKDAGEDMALRALPGSVDVTREVEDYTTRVVLLAEGEGTSIATGAADISPATAYKNLHGGALKLTRLVSESDTASGNATTRAQLQLNRFTSTRNALTLSTSDYDVHGSFVVGDRVWVYDPDSGLVDTSTEITFRGNRINPIKLQVTETNWAVTDAYTVAYRTAAGTWINLTDYVEFETDTTSTVTVGDFSRQLTDSSMEPVGSRPNADTSTPGQPTLIEPFTGIAYLDNRGFTRARVILSWNDPLNTDGSTVVDGDHYEIRYAVDTDMLYPATWAQLSAVRWQDLQTWSQPFAAPTGQWQTMVVNWDTTTAQLQDLSPGVGYDVQIRAVDKTGNIGAWSGTTTFVASSDNLPPSTPAAPTVAGSRIAVQVTHELGKSSGGTFNLESDLDHLEVHVSYEPTFTPDTTTLKGKTPANAGMIQAAIPVVFTVQVEETSARYVRVIAVDKTGNKSGPSDAATATALLIDDAHISDLTVTKVTAGTISASWVMAGEIKTADAGARARISADGYELYNTGGTRTFFADASTGNVNIVGQLVSGTSGRRLEINPTGVFLPEIRFYPSSGTNYGFINAFDVGSETSVGVGSSTYTFASVDVHSRVILSTTGAFLQTVQTDTQATLGGIVTSYANYASIKYSSAGVDGGTFFATATNGQVGWNISDSSNGQYFNFSSGKTYHIGQWENFSTPATDQGLFMGSAIFGTAAAATVSYGATLISNVIPVATCVSGNFGSATPTVWGIQSYSTSQFTMAWNNSQGMRINFWIFRTN
jgi:hypothetical protein